MDKIFIRAWILFVLFLCLIAIVAIRATNPKEEAGETALQRVKSSSPPKENPMILVPAGEFSMGSEEGGFDEKPIRQVYLDAFEINQYEITQSDYLEFVRATRHRSPLSRYLKNIESFNDQNQPVVYVAWEDADTYCRWRGWRLPTEAEWEKAARGGEGGVWPWGNEQKPVFANFLGEEDQSQYTAIVGSYQSDKSPYGIYDMAGNVREWVEDWYEEQYYRHAPFRNPSGPVEGKMKAMRGGSWNDSPLSGRATARMKMFPDYRDTTVGFRCAKTGAS
ncbi:MAG: formylglycine-generating enzyme family protein [Candidatus Manganitrophaceae bacterium]